MGIKHLEKETITIGKYQNSVDEYLKTVDWLPANHPMVVGLAMAGEELDAKFVSAMWVEANKTIKYIDDIKPVGKDDKKQDATPALLKPAA